jgi:peptidoglycan hydrolase-like protein with peptidoglycan-binding domain
MLAMTPAETLKIQRQLNAAGWQLEVDGIYGPATARAYQAWLNANTPEAMPTPAPAGAKPWWQSRAVIGVLVSLIAVITERMGWIVDANTLTTLVVQIAEVAGLALAFVGTVRRRAPIDGGLIVRGVRYADTTYPVPPDGPTDKTAGPFGY